MKNVVKVKGYKYMKKKLMAILLSLAMVSSTAPEAVTFAADTAVEETENETIVSDEDADQYEVISDDALPAEDSLTGSEDIQIEESAEEETVLDDEAGSAEEEVLSDDLYNYRKISDTEVAVTGIVAEDAEELAIPSELILEDAVYAVTAIEKGAFDGLSAEKLSIPAGVTSFGAQALPSLKTISVSEDNTAFTVKDGVLFTKAAEDEKADLLLYPAAADAESYIIPEKTGVIAEKAFAYVANLKTIVFGEGIDKIEQNAILTPANPLEIALAFYEVPAEIGEQAFVLDGADSNVIYLRSEEVLAAIEEIQPAYVYSPAMYDENDELVEDYSAAVSIVTEGIPESIQAMIDAANSTEEELDVVTEDESAVEKVPADESTDSLPKDSSLSEVPKDTTVAEEATVGAGPESLDANIAAGYYSMRNQAVARFLKIRNASIKESTDAYLAAYGSDMGATLSIIPLGSGLYKIVASCSNKALTLSADAADNVDVIQKAYTGDDKQKWYIREAESGVYKFYPYTNDAYAIDTKGQATASATKIVVTKVSSNKTQGWKLVTRTNPTENHLENGIYSISTSLASGKVLDIPAASKANGANVQIYQSNNSAAQQFILRYLGYGNLFRIINVNSNKALDTTGSKTGNNANVQQSNQSSSSTTQIWRIVKNSEGKYIVFNAGANRVLDVAAASTANGANVQIYSWNNTAAQKWNFKKVAAKTAVDISGKDAEIKAGWYTMTTARINRPIAVRNADLADNANVLIQAPRTGENTIFYIEPVGNEKYKIKAFCSNKVLTCVWGADSKDAGNVVQKTDSNLSTQRWYIRISKKNVNYLSICSTSDQNYVLTLKDNKPNYGTSVTAALSQGLNGQRWKLNKIDNPNLSIPYNNTTYKIESSLNSKMVVSTEAQSKKSQANVQLMQKVNGAGEFWTFKKVGYGNLYKITNSYTGLAMDAYAGGTADGTNVWMYSANDTNAQLWRVMPTDSTKTKFVIINAVSYKALDLAGGTVAANTNVQIYSQNDTDAQKWTLSRANINTYVPVSTAVTIRMKGNKNRLVEVKDGSTANGATVQMYAERGNTDQSFIFRKQTDGSYKILNAASNKYLDIESTASGAKIISTANANKDSQKWIITATGDNDASFKIENKATGLALTGGYPNRTVVTQKEYGRVKHQKFYFDTPVIKTGWQAVGSNWRYYDSKGNCYRNTFLEDGKYYFDASGNVLTGWKKYGAYYYYYRGKDGREYTDNRPYLAALFGSTGSKYNSQTRPNCSYYYTIDTARCVVTWYTQYPGTSDWNLPVVAFLCSPGTNATPTDAGGRKTGFSKEWIDLMGPSYGQYGTEVKAWTYIAGTRIIDWTNNGEYFHSVACGAANTHNLNPNTYNLLGTKQSHGCIRLGVRNAYWIYNFVNAGTMGRCYDNCPAPLRTLPQAWAITTIDPTDPHYTGNWGYVDSYATAYTNGAYIPRG